jgi:hypothetical protein
LQIISHHYPVQTEYKEDRHNCKWYPGLDMKLSSTTDDSEMPATVQRRMYPFISQ